MLKDYTRECPKCEIKDWYFKLISIKDYCIPLE